MAYARPLFSNTRLYVFLQNGPSCQSINQHQFVKMYFAMFYYNTWWMFCKCSAVLILKLQISPAWSSRHHSLNSSETFFWKSERDSGKNIFFICQSGTWEILCKSLGTSHSCCISPVHPICIRDMTESTLEIRVHNMRWMKQCGRLGELPS